MKKLPQIFTIVFFITVSSISIFAQKASRITFYKNATTATVSSSLRGLEDKKVFAIKVQKGQTLNVEQIKTPASLRYISVSIEKPAGEEVGDSDASCNNQKEIAPTETDDYKSTVFECQKADARRGRFRLKVTVK